MWLPEPVWMLYLTDNKYLKKTPSGKSHMFYNVKQPGSLSFRSDGDQPKISLQITYETSFYVSNYNMMGKMWIFCVTNLIIGMFNTKVHAL
jgi:hypothetical protein